MVRRDSFWQFGSLANKNATKCMSLAVSRRLAVWHTLAIKNCNSLDYPKSSILTVWMSSECLQCFFPQSSLKHIFDGLLTEFMITMPHTDTHGGISSK